MMDLVLSSILVLAFTSLQLGVVSRIPLQNGMADIVLLFIIVWCLNRQAKNFYIPVLIAGGLVTFISSLPVPAVFISYILAAVLTRLLVNRLWEMPVFSMLIITIAATFLQHLIYILILQFQGSSIPLLSSLSEITLPSIFLNIIFVFPMYLLIRDAQKFVYQEAENE
jgi:cell shape-determining protein MreD